MKLLCNISHRTLYSWNRKIEYWNVQKTSGRCWVLLSPTRSYPSTSSLPLWSLTSGRHEHLLWIIMSSWNCYRSVVVIIIIIVLMCCYCIVVVVCWSTLTYILTHRLVCMSWSVWVSWSVWMSCWYAPISFITSTNPLDQGVPNTSIAIDRSVAKVLWVDCMALKKSR